MVGVGPRPCAPRPLGAGSCTELPESSSSRPLEGKLGGQRAEGAGSASHKGPGLLLTDGLAVFQAFLRTEFSEENLEFWLACEDFKKVKSQSKMAAKAKKIFAEYIAIQACKEVRPPAGLSGLLSPSPVASRPS